MHPDRSPEAAIEAAVRRLETSSRWVLRLYVAGASTRSLGAVQRITTLCEQHLAGRYDLEVIDIYQQPGLAEAGDVVAAPTLVKLLPEPLRRVIGSMSDEGRVLVALGVPARA